MHGIKDVLMHDMDDLTDLGAQCVHLVGQLADRDCAFFQIHQHQHGEQVAQNGLGYLGDVDIVGGAYGGNLGQNAHSVLT